MTILRAIDDLLGIPRRRARTDAELRAEFDALQAEWERRRERVRTENERRRNVWPWARRALFPPPPVPRL